MDFETRIQAFLEQLAKVPDVPGVLETEGMVPEQIQNARLARYNARNKVRHAYLQLSEADRQKLDALACSRCSQRALSVLLQRVRAGGARALRCTAAELRQALEQAKADGVDLEAPLPDKLRLPRPKHCGQVRSRPARPPRERLPPEQQTSEDMPPRMVPRA